jgi:hypothetical protein
MIIAPISPGELPKSIVLLYTPTLPSLLDDVSLQFVPHDGHGFAELNTHPLKTRVIDPSEYTPSSAHIVNVTSVYIAVACANVGPSK